MAFLKLQVPTTYITLETVCKTSKNKTKYNKLIDSRAGYRFRCPDRFRFASSRFDSRFFKLHSVKIVKTKAIDIQKNEQ